MDLETGRRARPANADVHSPEADDEAEQANEQIAARRRPPTGGERDNEETVPGATGLESKGA